MKLADSGIANKEKFKKKYTSDRKDIEEENLNQNFVVEKKQKLTNLKKQINRVIYLPIGEIETNKNIRFKVDEESDDFKKLCESIKKFGLLNNIVVELHVKSDHENNFNLVCVSGHRRLAALRKIGLIEKIPCLLVEYDTSARDKRVGAALSENLNREGLGCVDIANGYQELTSLGWSDDELVKTFERTKKTISLYLRLASLPDDVKDSIRQHPDRLSTRVVFKDIIGKNKTDGEIRKAIGRKIKHKSASTNTQKNSKQTNISFMLDTFFKERKVSEEVKNIVLDAFKFARVLKG